MILSHRTSCMMGVGRLIHQVETRKGLGKALIFSHIGVFIVTFQGKEERLVL